MQILKPSTKRSRQDDASSAGPAMSSSLESGSLFEGSVYSDNREVQPNRLVFSFEDGDDSFCDEYSLGSIHRNVRVPQAVPKAEQPPSRTPSNSRTKRETACVPVKDGSVKPATFLSSAPRGARHGILISLLLVLVAMVSIIICLSLDNDESNKIQSASSLTDEDRGELRVNRTSLVGGSRPPSPSPTEATNNAFSPHTMPSVPTSSPTEVPSMNPTVSPVPTPVVVSASTTESEPSLSPTKIPILTPSYVPSSAPSVTSFPSFSPSATPSATTIPTAKPSAFPSVTSLPTTERAVVASEAEEDDDDDDDDEKGKKEKGEKEKKAKKAKKGSDEDDRR